MGYYKKGSQIIAIEQVDGFGKRPSLWIGHPGQFRKVASFNSFESADEFEEYLKIFFRPNLEENDTP